MFDIGTAELLLVAVVALLVIGPKELPNALRTLGRFTGKARAMTRHLRSGFDEMMRQAELEEMEKQWREHNAKIMAETPDLADPIDPLKTAPAAQAAAAATPAAATPANAQAEAPIAAPDAGDAAPLRP